MYSTHDEITKNFDELQSDILGEKLTNNPKMKESKILSKNKALATKQKTIINAINELLTAQQLLTKATNTDLTKIYSKLGNFGADPKLADELTARGVDTVFALAMKTYDDLQPIKDLAKDDYEDVFHVGENETQSEFKLTHKPLGKIRMYIDGIRYFKECIEYNAEDNIVKWVNSSDKEEGFDITDADVVFEYDYEVV